MAQAQQSRRQLCVCVGGGGPSPTAHQQRLAVGDCTLGSLIYRSNSSKEWMPGNKMQRAARGWVRGTSGVPPPQMPPLGRSRSGCLRPRPLLG